MRFPFDDSSVGELAGIPMSVYTRVAGSCSYSMSERMVFSGDGTTTSGYRWETIDGVLRVMSPDTSLLYSFDGLDICKGVVRAVGHTTGSSSKGNIQAVMCHEKALGKGWGVRISSHVKYVNDAVPPLLKALKEAGVSMSRVIVVVGGSKPDAQDYYDEDGTLFLGRTEELHGFVSLVPKQDADFGYWLCLHDTCGIMPGFVDAISGLDVGLAPDIVTLCETQAFEIGLFSSDFLFNLEFPKIATANISNYLRVISGVVVDYGARDKSMGKRDVYGTGNKREEFQIPVVGIRKFRGDKAAGGRP